MTDIIKRVEGKTLLAEVKTLAVIAGESAKKATHFLVAKQPTLATKATPNACEDVPLADKKAENEPQTTPGNHGSLESNKDRNRHTETAPAHSMIRRDRPIFIPIDRNWYHLGAQNAPSVRQTEIMQRPPGVYIGPFTGAPPAENVADCNEDHNWRRKEKSPHHRKEAVLEKNWPKPRAKRKHEEYVNKQYRHDKSVVCQTPRRRDGHKISNDMNNSTRLRFQTPTYLNGSQ